MHSRVSLIGRTLLVAAAALAMLLVVLSRANPGMAGAPAADDVAQTEPADDGAGIQATELISIPYGFEVGQTLTDSGNAVVVSGVGACTDGQTITITFTVTQASTGATAAGEWNGDCTGALQTWMSEGTLTGTSPTLSAGLAEACAFAETRDGGTVTGSQSWCDPIILNTEPLETVFGPAVLKP